MTNAYSYTAVLALGNLAKYRNIAKPHAQFCAKGREKSDNLLKSTTQLNCTYTLCRMRLHRGNASGGGLIRQHYSAQLAYSHKWSLIFFSAFDTNDTVSKKDLMQSLLGVLSQGCRQTAVSADTREIWLVYNEEILYMYKGKDKIFTTANKRLWATIPCDLGA